MEKYELWQAVLAKIEPILSRPNFLTWFQGTAVTDLTNGTATVCVPSGFVREWLQQKYHKSILHAMRDINSDIKEVAYVIGAPDTPRSGAPLKDSFLRRRHHAAPPPFLPDDLSIRELSVNPETSLNPRYTFANFIVGSFNELSHAAAQSVVKGLGTTYNPFFIYGGVGLGKTHLIQAIGNEVLTRHPQLKVRYMSSERYMSEIVEALRHQQMGILKEKYRSVDLLIIDDIQFIARTEKIQEEFFHTFNALYERNRQIVISSDRPPQALATLEARLRSRFEGGMIADVGFPDFETRLTILKTKAETKDIALSEDVLKLIAETIKNNIRELEGALNKLVMASKLSAAPIDADAARKIMAAHTAAPKKFLSYKKILKAVADFYDMSERDIVQHSRKKDVVRPRQIAMYLIRENLKTSYPSIGEKFGGRDHTTVIHSCEKVAQDLLINPELEDELKAIKERITVA